MPTALHIHITFIQTIHAMLKPATANITNINVAQLANALWLTVRLMVQPQLGLVMIM